MTAVEWYDAQLKEIDYKLQSGLINFTQCKVLMDEAKIQAKEIEKEQIIKAVYHTCSAMSHSDIPCGEQYYNETFNYEPNKCYHPLTERKHTSDTHFECTICGYNNY